MSIECQYWVTCDECGTDSGEGLETATLAARYATEEGWDLGADADLCPDCAEAKQ